MKLVTLLLLSCIALAGSPITQAADIIRHELNVELVPEKALIKAEDRITLPPDRTQEPIIFHLNPNLRIVSSDREIIPIGNNSAADARYRVKLPPGADSFSIKYEGMIQNGLADISDAVGRTQEITQGLIGKDGVYLDGASSWYPDLGGMLEFTLHLELPEGWRGVSQGKAITDGWQEKSPQQEIYLVAAPFTVYSQSFSGIKAQVYLRDPDQELADRYLDATRRYIEMYSQMLGDYPYTKFALVENFWESGYGMPSFTLLGPTVLRLPFIIHTSYPHEILHNWWGNSVYVDYSTGNWSEGLTAYLSDHLLKEKQGQGADYRRDTLKKFTDYVREENDFPLSRFRGRHGDASAAVGYDKSLMAFHMLRKRVGDAVFFRGLRRFYRDNRFKVTGFDDLQTAMEKESGEDLNDFFQQWLNRTGAPKLELDSVLLDESDGYRLDLTIRQTQKTKPFSLEVPLSIQYHDREEVKLVLADQAETQVSLQLPGRPESVSLDANFDLFRALDANEVAVSLGAFFGAQQALIVLPAAAKKPLLDAYKTLAANWAGSRKGKWSVVMDEDIEHLPRDKVILILGKANLYYPRGNSVLPSGVSPFTPQITGRAFITTGESPARVYLSADTPQAVQALARKLPHYGKYSYIGLSGVPPQVSVKGQWPVKNSPLSRCFDATGVVACDAN